MVTGDGKTRNTLANHDAGQECKSGTVTVQFGKLLPKPNPGNKPEQPPSSPAVRSLLTLLIQGAFVALDGRDHRLDVLFTEIMSALIFERLCE